MLRYWVAFLFLVFSASVSAQSLDGFERVFIPFKDADITGLGGASFRTRGTSIPRSSYTYWPHCGFGATAPMFGRVERDSGVPLPLMCAGGSRGRILFIERGAADQVSFGYVLSSSAAGSGGLTHRVSIPIVRERDLRHEPFHIVVPYSTGRVTLRVYELSGRSDAAVRVGVRASIFSWGFAYPPEVVTLSSREGDDPSYPSFIEMPLDLACFPTSPRICTIWDAAIEIEPLTDGDYWALVSRTDGVTQQVTLYWPQ